MEIGSYWKMGLRFGLAGSEQRLRLFGRFEFPQSWYRCLVTDSKIVDFLAAFLNGGQSSFSQPSLTDNLIHCEISNGLSVHTFRKRNNESLSLCPDHLIVVQFESCWDVTCSFISQQTNAEFCVHLITLFLKPKLLVEDKFAFLRRCDLSGEGLSPMLDDHPTWELHFHLDGHQREVELHSLLLVGHGHRSQVPIWTFELYKYINLSDYCSEP